MVDRDNIGSMLELTGWTNLGPMSVDIYFYPPPPQCCNSRFFEDKTEIDIIIPTITRGAFTGRLTKKIYQKKCLMFSVDTKYCQSVCFSNLKV